MTDSTVAAPTERRGVPIWAQVIIWVVLAGLLAMVAIQLKKSQQGTVQPGEKIADFSMPLFSGYELNGASTVKLADLRGKVVVINFWASWCPPCRDKAAYLEQTWRKYQDQDVIFIGVDYADTEKAALAYMKEFDITYFNGPDLGTRISQSYNIKGVPETYFVAKDGTLRGNHIGPLQSPVLDNKIDALLAEPYSAK